MQALSCVFVSFLQRKGRWVQMIKHFHNSKCPIQIHWIELLLEFCFISLENQLSRINWNCVILLFNWIGSQREKCLKTFWEVSPTLENFIANFVFFQEMHIFDGCTIQKYRLNYLKFVNFVAIISQIHIFHTPKHYMRTKHM